MAALETTFESDDGICDYRSLSVSPIEQGRPPSQNSMLGGDLSGPDHGTFEATHGSESRPRSRICESEDTPLINNTGPRIAVDEHYDVQVRSHLIRRRPVPSGSADLQAEVESLASQQSDDGSNKPCEHVCLGDMD